MVNAERLGEGAIGAGAGVGALTGAVAAGGVGAPAVASADTVGAIVAEATVGTAVAVADFTHVSSDRLIKSISGEPRSRRTGDRRARTLLRPLLGSAAPVEDADGVTRPKKRKISFK